MSCRSVKEITENRRDLPNITEGKLFKNIISNELDYNTIYAKKVDLSLKDNKNSHSLKAILRIQRDSFIWVSVSASLGVDVARLLLTPDSVKFISPREKNILFRIIVILERFDVGLTFDCFQRILTNQFFYFESCNTEAVRGKRYKFDKSGNDYVLYSLEEKALGRKLRKLYKKRRKNKEFSLVLQKIHIDPDCFRPNAVSIEDLEEG
ncbi:MAG: DUF4292 domain-containing protein [Butyricimonas faecihominis]